MKKIILYIVLLIIFLVGFFIIINLSVKTTNNNMKETTTTETTTSVEVKRELTNDLYLNDSTASYWEEYFKSLYSSNNGNIEFDYYIDFHDPDYSFYVTDKDGSVIEVYTMKDGIKEIHDSKNNIIEIK